MIKNFWEHVWKILQEECDAGDDHFGFVHCAGNFSEWRFQGSLGFGGKIRFNSVCKELYVYCYPEDLTLERTEMINRANIRLQRMYWKWMKKVIP